MPVVVPRYTIWDLESFPDDGNRYELLDGILHVSPGPAPLHELVVGQILWALNNYLRPSVARVFPRGTVQVAPNNHLEPDVLVVPAEGLEAGIRRGTRWTAVRHWWLAVEVSGPDSRVYDRDHKMPAYLALGAREVWRADLDEECVYVARQEAPVPIRHAERLVWSPPGLEAPLEIEVPSLFEAWPPTA